MELWQKHILYYILALSLSIIDGFIMSDDFKKISWDNKIKYTFAWSIVVYMAIKTLFGEINLMFYSLRRKYGYSL